MATKILIIGSGVSGASVAYRLSHFATKHGLNLDIRVFEKDDRPGGRTRRVEFEGQIIEIGGTLVHSSNLRIVELMQFASVGETVSGLNLDGKNETLGFFDGHKIYLRAKNNMISLALVLIKQYGPLSAWNFRSSALKTVNRWKEVYQFQQSHAGVLGSGQLVEQLDLIDEAECSLQEYFEKKHISRKLIEGLAGAIIQNMYLQDQNINAFAGQVGLAGAGLAGGHLFAIDGGNGEMFGNVIIKAGAKLELNTKVNQITPINSGGYKVEYSQLSASLSNHQTSSATTSTAVSTRPNQKNLTENFDIVVIATPMELADIELNIADQPQLRPYQPVEVTLVSGDLRPSYFGLKSAAELTSSVFIHPNSGLSYKSVGVTGQTSSGQRIYKVFSDSPLDDIVISQIFKKVSAVKTFSWVGAYPKLIPSNPWPSFRLQKNLYYCNGFETAAASMETNAVAAWNIADLIESSWLDSFNNEESFDNTRPNLARAQLNKKVDK
jgi:prenylcysteine oxidase/farnesylcysteine lyase